MSLFFHQRNEDPTPLKLTRHRRLLIAFIVIMVGLVVVVALSVWPERTPKDLKLRLKFVRSEVVDGKTKLLFRVEGADQYAINVKGYSYLHEKEPPHHGISSFFLMTSYYPSGREFWADPPQSNSDSPDQGCKMQADVSVLVPDNKLSKVCSVVKDAWRMHKLSKRSLFVTAKFFWQINYQHPIGEQIIISDVPTNPPVVHFPPNQF